MRFHLLSTQLFIPIVLLTHCSATKDNLRGGTGERKGDIQASIQQSEENRFLNLFGEDENEEKGGTTTDTERYMIKYKSHDGLMRLQSKKRSIKHAIMTMTTFSMQVVNLSKEEVKELEDDEDVLYVEPDPKRYLMDSFPHTRTLQDDEEVPYGIDLVGALKVPDDLVANRKVCIIDTGYDIEHPDLPNSSDIVSGDDNGSNRWDKDGNGHGTHVAGTIAAVGDNGKGVVGVNRSGKLGLHIIRIFGDNGRPIFGSTLMSVAEQCVDAGSNIISMSLGGPISNRIERDFFQTIFEQRNVLVVAAAGNSGNTRNSYPASYDAVMSVAAIDEDKKLAYFSQRNKQVEISAPGVAVLSTQVGGGYIAYSGTSMACPHVAGVAALVWSHATSLSSIEIRDVLRETAEDLGDLGRDNSFGFGLVRADSAYQMISDGNFTLVPTVAPTPERECFDFANYKNGRGDGCDWYEGGIFINRCSFFGSRRANSEGVTGDEACCACGGGGYATVPSASPTVSTQCVDLDSWVDSNGRGCDWYGGWRCTFFGDSRENDGIVANEACCKCKELLL